MKAKETSITTNLKDRQFDIINYIIMAIVVIIMLYPFLNVFAISLNESSDTVKGGLHIWPREFTLDNYQKLFQFHTLLTGFQNSVLRTVIGTVLGLFCDSMVAYTLSRKDFQGRKFVSVFMALTLFFSGGLIPTYILIRDLHLMNSFWVYIFPTMVNAFNIFIIRSFMDGLPFSLQESAKLDGANDFTIYWRVILPLCKPVLATIALFIAVFQWNQWFDTYLYNSMSANLTTLQFELMKLLQSTSAGNTAVHGESAAQLAKRVSPQSLKMAITIVVTVPILVVYPFLQKYFVKGMTLGAVKN